NENTAYVTLRTGTGCAGNNNQLDIIDIKNLSLPKLIKSVPMLNPHGLALYNDKLFICEGKYGLKILETKSDDVNELAFNKNIESEDIIILDERTALLIGPQGFYMLDVSNPKSVKIISSILKE
ncbi:MAG TPA: hypothetical protein PKD85_22140, partial [Saprospiraceae bacterium]|nr:hypothetical protein [Saprospiraceae bacterium]